MRIRSKFVPTNIEGTTFNDVVYKQAGVYILKGIISISEIEELQSHWLKFYNQLKSNGGRSQDKNNAVNFSDDLPPALRDYWKSKTIKDIAIKIHGDNVALYNHRIVMKDRQSVTNIFLHQDYCYHLGFPEKCSLFIPLFKCGKNEGTLSFYPGTHQYGYLGDAGEIDDSKFSHWNKITPELLPGDVVIMNSCVWHESGPNFSDIDRVLFDIIIQPSDDPSGKALINGNWLTDFWINRQKDYEIDTLFVNCRTKKLKEFYNSQNKVN